MADIKTEKFICQLFIVDAFTKCPFKGNGAAVCIMPDEEEIPTETMQNIAAEMNLSETAFISRIKDKSSLFNLRWFTPTCEVSLCGHATLASAAVLFYVSDFQLRMLEFQTLSGILKAERFQDGKIKIILPAYKSRPAKEEYLNVVKAAVGSLPVEEVVLSESKNLLVRLEDSVTRQELQQFKPKDHELMAAASDLKGIIVTLKACEKNDCVDEDGNRFDFISRYFAPWLGVSEDPVTGSAHSVLAPYWSKILKKGKLYARQCSIRGGNLHIMVTENEIAITGDTVIVVQGLIEF